MKALVLLLQRMLPLLLGCLLAYPAPVAAQRDGAATLAQIEVALRTGDARLLLGSAADRLEIGIFGVSTLYSRAQALYVMQEFFRQYPPKDFSFREPSATSGGWFSAGYYQSTMQARALRIYVHLRQRDDQWQLREIRIE